MIESKESKTRDIPLWLTAVVILLCIGGGGWLVKWYLKEQPRQVVEIPDDKVTPTNTGKNWRGQFTGNTGGNSNNNSGYRTQARLDINANGVQPWGRNSFRAKVGDTVMNVIYNGKNGFDISPQYLNARTAEQAELAVMRMSILQDAAWRDTLDVTPAQLDKLRVVPPPKSMTLDPADKAKLTELWKAYHDGPSDKKAAAEKELLAGLDEVGQKNLPATKEYEANRAALVRAALTPEQIKLYRDGGKTAKPKEPVPAVPAAVKTGDVERFSSKPLLSKRIGAEAVVTPTPLPMPAVEVKTPATKPAATAPVVAPAIAKPAAAVDAPK